MAKKRILDYYAIEQIAAKFGTQRAVARHLKIVASGITQYIKRDPKFKEALENGFECFKKNKPTKTPEPVEPVKNDYPARDVVLEAIRAGNHTIRTIKIATGLSCSEVLREVTILTDLEIETKKVVGLTAYFIKDKIPEGRLILGGTGGVMVAEDEERATGLEPDNIRPCEQSEPDPLDFPPPPAYYDHQPVKSVEPIEKSAHRSASEKILEAIGNGCHLVRQIREATCLDTIEINFTLDYLTLSNDPVERVEGPDFTAYFLKGEKTAGRLILTESGVKSVEAVSEYVLGINEMEDEKNAAGLEPENTIACEQSEPGPLDFPPPPYIDKLIEKAKLRGNGTVSLEILDDPVLELPPFDVTPDHYKCLIEILRADMNDTQKDAVWTLIKYLKENEI